MVIGSQGLLIALEVSEPGALAVVSPGILRVEEDGLIIGSYCLLVAVEVAKRLAFIFVG